MEQSEGGAPGRVEDGSWLSREQRHALKNIFSIIVANAEMVGEEMEAVGPGRRRLERIIEACRRGEELVQAMGPSPQAAPGAHERQPDRPSEPALSSGRILVVDDEQDIVAIISRYLLKAGYSVQGMTDSRLALERLRTNPLAFDLLVTDVDMPALSGVSLCRQAHVLRPGLPVLMITGYDRHISDEQLSELGVGGLLAKPLNRQALLSTVHRLLAS